MEIVWVRRAVISSGSLSAILGAGIPQRRDQQKVTIRERLEHAPAPGALLLATPAVARAGDRRAAAKSRHHVGPEYLGGLLEAVAVKPGGLCEHELARHVESLGPSGELDLLDHRAQPLECGGGFPHRFGDRHNRVLQPIADEQADPQSLRAAPAGPPT